MTVSDVQALHGWDHSVMYDMYTWDSVRDLASTHDLALRCIHMASSLLYSNTQQMLTQCTYMREYQS